MPPFNALFQGKASEWVEVRGDDAELYLRGPAHETWKTAKSRHPDDKDTSLFTDKEFPAEPSSIDGQRGLVRPNLIGDRSAPLCRCNVEAREDTVRREGPNKGRAHWHCAARKCGFFCWADRVQVQPCQMTWRRSSDSLVVTDFGFRAADLRQGAVGDCWFLSALAVVAERHDLILKLFAGGCERAASGCYLLRLFLDGQWACVVVDDSFPCTDKQRRPDGTGLAYSRASSKQLWVPLIEKAYAKSHGSYKAISGGHVAEALHDLTGAPVETLDFDAPGFDPDKLWEQLLSFRRSGFPMGCGTVGNPELEQVGLFGMHAYSILDVREVRDSSQALRGFERSAELSYGRAKDPCTLRLVRLRNPHGIGEWSGDWSDSSPSWTAEIASQLVSDGEHCAPTGLHDGTFWMDFPHFLSAFHDVEVCKAHRGWHARSFHNAFPTRLCQTTACVCREVYLIRISGASNAQLYISILQPTKRGAWCREDRKKSYRLGDGSLVLLRLEAAENYSPSSWKPVSAVAGGLFGTKRDNHVYCELADPDSLYLLVCFSFGYGPHAAETRDAAPFRVRFYSSEPLKVQTHQASSVPGKALTEALHLTLLRLPAWNRQQQPSRNLGGCLKVLLVQGEGTVALLAANTGSNDAQVRIIILAVGMIARSGAGILADLEASSSKTRNGHGFLASRSGLCFACGGQGHYARDCPKARNGIRGAAWGRWGPPVEKRYAALEMVPAGSQRLVMVIVQSAQSWGLQALEVEAVQTAEMHVPDNKTIDELKLEPLCVPRDGLFAPQTCNVAQWEEAEKDAFDAEAGAMGQALDISDRTQQQSLQEALIESEKSFKSEERRLLKAALAESRGEPGSNLEAPAKGGHVVIAVEDSGAGDLQLSSRDAFAQSLQASCASLVQDEARQLEVALASSKLEAQHHSARSSELAPIDLISDDDESEPAAKRLKPATSPC
eukprot:TRINITY_DN81823_c0_g1_i1.p1 TRINITY_DN81823_c0_g1~~TRINITY_DN81823_c0_g1_i1.p1  ORF type:complete len:950 (-),score=132.17 TRINITY_DN81823_c0_g1_i1:47-2896(-)